MQYSNNHKTRTGLLSALFAGLLMFGGMAAYASDYSDEQIQNQIAAMLEINEMQQEWQERMAAAGDDPEAQQQVEADLIETMEQTAQSHGITTDEYNDIMQRAFTDDEFRERYNEHLEEHGMRLEPPQG